VELTTNDGRRLVVETRYPKGHPGNAMSDEEVEAKFRGLAGAALAPAACDRVLAEVWGLDRAPSLDGLFAALATDAPAR
jgi:2-methylcitrate dehydratase